MAEGSTALASARTSTCAAPARFSTRAQASTVAPVVMTSSTTTMRLPRIRSRRAVAWNAPATFFPRCAAVSPTWLGVRLTRASRKQSNRNSRQSGHRLRQNGRLVEAPRPEPGPVEGDGHDDVCSGEKLGPRCRHPPPEQGYAFMPIPIFESLDQLAHGRRIARGGPPSVVDWGFGHGRCGKARLAGIIRQRQAEFRA